VSGRHDSPSELIVDSQSVKTANYVHEAVDYDGAKHIKGRKRYTVVDTLGLVLRVWVSAANVGERKGAKAVLQRVKVMGQTVQRVITVWADGGYDGNPLYRWAIDGLGWVLWVILRPQQGKGFIPVPQRWQVERTFGWGNCYRRLSKDYELKPQTSETFIYLAMIRTMMRIMA
jgi:transposase